MSDTFIDWYTEAYPFPHQHRTGGSVPIDMLTIEQDTTAVLDRYDGVLVISNLIAQDMMHASLDCGDGQIELLTSTNRPVIHTPNTECLYDVAGPHTLRIASIPEGALHDTFAQAGVHDIGVLDRIAFQATPDPVIARAMDEMWLESNRHGAASALLIDGLYHTILGRLLRRATAAPAPAPRPSLGSSGIAAAIEAMEAHLDGPVTTAMLAAAAGVSPFHFARAFKAEVGETPHQHLTGRRLARGRELLAATNTPIAVVALDCGFSSQSHMTAAFTKWLGITPARFRREQRG